MRIQNSIMSAKYLTWQMLKAMTEIARRRISLARSELSRLIRLNFEADVIILNEVVLDYGCDRGDELIGLNALGINCSRWESLFRPEIELNEADVVTYDRLRP